MCVVFMVSSGVILVHMVPAGRTAKSICVKNNFKIARGSDTLFKLKYCVVQRSVGKWVKSHQKSISYAGEYFEKE